MAEILRVAARSTVRADPPTSDRRGGSSDAADTSTCSQVAKKRVFIGLEIEIVSRELRYDTRATKIDQEVTSHSSLYTVFWVTLHDRFRNQCFPWYGSVILFRLGLCIYFS